MLRYLVLWSVATTTVFLTIAFSGGAVIASIIVVGLIGAGGYTLKNTDSDQKIATATISLTAVILAGLVVPTGMTELARNFELGDRFVLSVTALGVVTILGSSIELIRQIETE